MTSPCKTALIPKTVCCLSLLACCLCADAQNFAPPTPSPVRGPQPGVVIIPIERPPLPESEAAQVDSTLSNIQSTIVEQKKTGNQQQQMIQAEVQQKDALIQKLQAQVNDTDGMKALVQAMNERLKTVETVNQQAQQNQISIQQQRYLAGAKILAAMTHDAETLQITTDMTTNVSQFQTTTSVLNFPMFQSAIRSITGDLTGNNDDFLDSTTLQTTPGLEKFFANPYISVAYSIVSLFHNPRMRRNDKLANLRQVVPILDLATKSDNDAHVLQQELTSMSGQLQKLQSDSKATFTTYVTTVGYSHDYDYYRQDVLADQTLAMNNQQFFAAQLNQTATPGGLRPLPLQEATLNLNTVSGLVSRYQMLLDQMNGLLVNLSATIQTCLDGMVGTAFPDGTRDSLRKLHEKNEDLRKDFVSVYQEPIRKWQALLVAN